MTSLETDIILAVTVARKAEVFLTELGATGDGLGKKIASIKSKISRMSLRLLGDLQLFNSARNDLVHSKSSTVQLPEPFALLASKLDVQIDYFAQQLGLSIPSSHNGHAAPSTDIVVPRISSESTAEVESASGVSSTKKTQFKSSHAIDLEVLPPETVDSAGENGLVKFGSRRPPRSWIVDGTDGLGDYVTIQDAIDAASDGDSIRVLPGNYTGPIRIEKNIVLEGQGSPDETTITADEDILYVAGFGAKISNITFRSNIPRVFGIVAANLSLVVISECTFAIQGGTGIIAFDDSSLRIESCRVVQCHHGLRITGASVEVFKNYFSENTNAILLEADGKAKIYNNDFVQNGSGVEVQDGGQAEISGNRFTGGSAGVIAEKDAEGTVQSNNFAGLQEAFEVFYPSESSKLISL